MSTVAKAISLLEMLGHGAPETALADLAKGAGFDKATTRRLLVSLIAQGLVEQDETTRLYRLGAGLTRLALMREAQFPFLRMAVPMIEALAAQTEETVHLSEYSRRGLLTVHVIESTKANRVSVPLGELLPMHATASGIAFLAFAEKPADVLLLETGLGGNKDTRGDMRVASDGQRPGRKKDDIWINSHVRTNRNVFNANERYTFMDHYVMPQ